MKMKYLGMMQMVFFVLLSLVSGELNAQSSQYTSRKSDMVLLPNPKPWSFVHHGNYDVSYYTGSVDVSVDLVDINVGALHLPIRCRYNFTENKPSTIPGELGLGFLLEAGGVVTRVMKGIPDEKNGFYYNQGAQGMYSNTKDLYINDAMNAIIDNEPDIFYYRFGDFSGSFYFGSSTGEIVTNGFNNLKIVPRSVSSNISGFDITTPDGIKYEFSEIEKSKYHASEAHGKVDYNSAWWLKNITLTNGQIISFEYYPNSFLISTGAHVLSYSEVEEGGVVPPHGSLNKFYSDVRPQFQVYLKSIIFPSGRLEVGMANRTDRGASKAKKIDKITLLNSFSEIVKNYEFSYFENNTERLKLHKIFEKIGGETVLYREFQYDSGKLPWHIFTDNFDAPYSSPAVDHWGYYNGETQNRSKSLVPLHYIKNQRHGAAVRTPDLSFAKSEILTKVKYATGGYSEFKYELHDFPKQGNSYSPLMDETINTKMFFMEYEQGNSSPYYPVGDIFTLTASQKITIHKEIRGAGPNTKWLGVRGWTHTRDTVLAPGNYNVATLLNVNYLYHADNSDIETASGRISYVDNSGRRVPISETNVGYGGGLRIKEIKNFDGVNPVSTKQYRYVKELSSSVSSGILTLMPTYGIDLSDMTPQVTGVFYSSNPILAYNESEVIGYSSVYEVNDDGSYRKFKYSSLEDHPDLLAPYHLVTIDSLLLPRISRRIERGKLMQEEIYSNNNTLLNRVSYDYQTKNDNRSKNISYILLTPTFSIPTVPHTMFTMHGQYTRMFPFKVLAKKTEINFNSAENVTSTIEYFYDNDLHSFPTRTQKASSTGAVIHNYITYPQDYLTTFSDLINSNIVQVPIENVRTVNDVQKKVSDGEITLYDNKGNLRQIFNLSEERAYSSFRLSNRNAGVWPPSDSYGVFQKDSGYRLSVDVLHFDIYGNPLEVKQQSLPSTVYLWGYEGQYPVAKIENATYTDVLAALGSGTIATNKLNLLNAVNVSDATLTSTIGELRSAPGLSKSQISSYTYKPLMGMTSMTDPRGIKTEYKYDGFQRLKDVVDFEGNVLKNYRYHYRP